MLPLTNNIFNPSDGIWSLKSTALGHTSVPIDCSDLTLWNNQLYSEDPKDHMHGVRVEHHQNLHIPCLQDNNVHSLYLRIMPVLSCVIFLHGKTATLIKNKEKTTISTIISNLC